MNDTPSLHPTRRQVLVAAGALSFRAGASRALGAEAPSLRAQRLGWAGVRLELPGDHLYLDPLMNPDVWGQQLGAPLTAIEPQPGNRTVLVTHRHPDHFDPVAVKAALGEGGSLLSAEPVGVLPAPAGSRARAVRLYEPQVVGEFTVLAIPASDGYGDPQVSWIVTGGGRRILHAGDTMWHGQWWAVGRQYGPFDAAFLPVNGARFGWRKPVSDVPGVMTPHEAVAVCILTGARLLVPIHYGVTPSDDYREVPDPIGELARVAKARSVALEVAAPGDWLRWQANR